MPNRPFHVVTSTTAGAVYSWQRSGGQPDGARALETLGGSIGGYLGGRAPDCLDPPCLGPRHRGHAHSITVAATLVGVGAAAIPEWQQHCRARADGFAAKRAACTPGSGEAIWLAIAEAFWRMLAGLLAGFLAGYLMHLATDACTPSSLGVI
ncbi:MAG: hypothetical protein ACRELE_05405 [Gemmatimonadales bacterium]